MFLLEQEYEFSVVRPNTQAVVYQVVIPRGMTIKTANVETFLQDAASYFKKRALLNPEGIYAGADRHDVLLVNVAMYGSITDADMEAVVDGVRDESIIESMTHPEFIAISDQKYLH